MGNGGPGDPADVPAPTDLKKPPAIIEGPAGGPSVPVGPSQADKDKAADGAFIANGAAAVYTIGGVIAVGSGMGSPAGVVFGVSAGLLSGLGAVAGKIANDPPSPYRRIVRFRRVSSVPPTVPEPIASKFGVAIQSMAFATVTAEGLLAAMEQYAGAVADGDIDWAINHNAVVRATWRFLGIDLTTVAAATWAAADALAQSDFDIEFTSENVDAAQKWVFSREEATLLRTGLSDAGMTRSGVADAMRYIGSKPELPSDHEPTLSASMQSYAQRLHDIGVNIFETDRFW